MGGEGRTSMVKVRADRNQVGAFHISALGGGGGAGGGGGIMSRPGRGRQAGIDSIG